MKANINKNIVKKKEYIWQGYDANAQKQSGTLKANSLEHAKEYFKEKNIYLKSIEEKKNEKYSFEKIRNYFFLKSNKTIHLYSFTKQLFSLLNAGINLEKSILSIKNSTKNTDVQKILAEIHFDLTRGDSFLLCLEKHPYFFPKMYLSIIGIASESRKFNQTIADLASYLKKKDTLDKEIKKALLYPKIILFITLGLTLVLLVKIVPVFSQIYQNSSNSVDLPALSSFIMNLSNLINSHFEFFLLAIASVYFLFRLIKKNEYITPIFNKLILKIPVIGDLVIKSNVAQIFRMIATLEQSKLNFVEIIKMVSENTSNLLFKNALVKIANEVESGGLIAKAFADSEVFPEYTVQMIDTGENTNQMSNMLETIANMYESEVNEALDKFKVMIEPLTMLILSLIVATIVIGMYLPIFSMGSIL